MLFSKLALTLAAFASAAVASPTPAGDEAAPAAGDAAPSGVDAKDWKGCPGNVNVCINSVRSTIHGAS